MTSSRATGVPQRGGDECDAFSRYARQVLCYLGRAGAVKAAKRSYNRRVRRSRVEMDETSIEGEGE